MWLFSSLKTAYSNLKRVVAPFFTRENLNDGLRSGLSLVAIQVTQFFIYNYFVSQIENDDLDQNQQYAATLGNISVDIVSFALHYATIQYASNVFNNVSQKNICDRFLSNRASIGVEFVKDFEKQFESTEKEAVEIGQLISLHLKQLSDGLVSLTAENASALSAIAMNLYFASRLAKNNNVILAAGTAAVVLASFSACLNQKRVAIDIQDAELQDRLIARINEVYANRTQVVSLNAENTEAELLRDILKSRKQFFNKIFGLDFTNISIIITAFIAFPIIIKLFAPSLGLLTPKQFQNRALMDAFSLQMTSIMGYLRDMIINFSTKYPKMKVSFNKIDTLYRRLEIWEDFIRSDAYRLKRQFEQNEFSVNRLIMAVPSYNLSHDAEKISFSQYVKNTVADPKAQVLHDVEFSFLRAGVYRLMAPSGVGKSTFLKLLTGQWPYSSGDICFDCKPEELCFVPQAAYFPGGTTLCEAILYRPGAPSESEKESIIALMDLLNLDYDVMKYLDIKKDNWDFLSHGQKQRLSIVRILLSQPAPKILLLDEITASIDAQNAEVVEKLIRGRYPEATIIYVSHQATRLDCAEVKEDEERKVFREEQEARELDSAAPLARQSSYLTSEMREMKMVISHSEESAEEKKSEDISYRSFQPNDLVVDPNEANEVVVEISERPAPVLLAYALLKNNPGFSALAQPLHLDNEDRTLRLDI